MHYLAAQKRAVLYHLHLASHLVSKSSSGFPCKNIGIGPLVTFYFDEQKCSETILAIKELYERLKRMKEVNVIFFLRIDVLEDFERRNLDIFYRLAWRHSCTSKPPRYVEQDELVKSEKFVEEWTAIIQLYFLVMNGVSEDLSQILLEAILGTPLINHG